MCAVDILMICDSLFRSTDPLERRMYVKIVETVRSFGGTVHIVPSRHVAGEGKSHHHNLVLIAYGCFVCTCVYVSTNVLSWIPSRSKYISKTNIFGPWVMHVIEHRNVKCGFQWLKYIKISLLVPEDNYS